MGSRLSRKELFRHIADLQKELDDLTSRVYELETGHRLAEPNEYYLTNVYEVSVDGVVEQHQVFAMDLARQIKKEMDRY